MSLSEQSFPDDFALEKLDSKRQIHLLLQIVLQNTQESWISHIWTKFESIRLYDGIFLYIPYTVINFKFLYTLLLYLILF